MNTVTAYLVFYTPAGATKDYGPKVFLDSDAALAEGQRLAEIEPRVRVDAHTTDGSGICITLKTWRTPSDGDVGYPTFSNPNRR